MCGITACVGGADAASRLLVGLGNLEYRGYDSAGVGLQNGSGLEILKREGEVERLVEQVTTHDPSGTIGIGHTRWSTHGPPSDENAHPHTDCHETVAVVHNGIIENYAELREELEARGHEFTSETDTEVVPHLVEERLEADPPEMAFRNAVDRIEGSYAIVALVEGSERLFATRQGSPLVLGLGEDCYFLASDVPAFLEYTEDVVYLEDGDVVVADADGYRVTDGDGHPVERPQRSVDWTQDDAEKGEYDHYMLKEIHEQPVALRQTVGGQIDELDDTVRLADLPDDTFEDVTDVQLVACGTSYHAARYGAHLLADAGVPAQTFLASEYATAPAPTNEGTLVVGVTQSGETADTLAALRTAAAGGARTLAVTNVVGSSAARECDEVLFIRAGPEIGVAATKTFSSQVVTLLLLAERLGGVRPVVGRHDLLSAVRRLPDDVQQVLDTSDAARVAASYADANAYFFIGRGTGYPVALEGALKFKEITYEHAEGFAGGELKHGPLALVTPDTPVFAVFTGESDEKLLNNVEEIQTRGAPVVAVGPDATGDVARVADETLSVPETHPAVAGLLANVQLQLVSYHAATLLDRPIDKPRNLAKSVTVE